VLAGGRCEVLEPGNLVGVEYDGVGGYVLLDPADRLRAGEWGDVVAFGEQPGEGRPVEVAKTATLHTRTRQTGAYALGSETGE
jgi:hypothetical protein